MGSVLLFYVFNALAAISSKIVGEILVVAGGCEEDSWRAVMSMSMSGPVTRMLLGSWLLLMNFSPIGQDNCSCRGFPS